MCLKSSSLEMRSRGADSRSHGTSQGGLGNEGNSPQPSDPAAPSAAVLCFQRTWELQDHGMLILPQPLCSAEAGGASKQRAAARLGEKTIQPLPHRTSSPKHRKLQLEQGRVPLREGISEKKPREIGSFCLSEIAFPSKICSHSRAHTGLGLC